MSNLNREISSTILLLIDRSVKITDMRLALGVKYDLPPIPLDRERTTWFSAGSVTFGVEERVLDEAVVRVTFSDQQRARSAIEDVQDGAFANDGGFSVHVCEAGSGRELLRFDCFAETPHYHYIAVDGGNHAIAFDADANGDMVSWVAVCLRSRLPAMLRRVGAAYLVSGLIAGDVDEAVTALAAELERRTGGERHGPAR